MSESEASDVKHLRQLSARVTLGRRWVLGIVPTVLCEAWRREHSSNAPLIAFTRISQADPPGSAHNDIIEGRVTGALPGQKIVLYAKTAKDAQYPLQPYYVAASVYRFNEPAEG
jgi:hypothetical protein